MIDDKKVVLITGCAGLIGSRLANWLIKNKPNVTVVGIDNLSGGYLENVPSEVIFYQKDVLDSSLSEIFLKHKPNYVFHLAAYAAECLSPFIRKFNYTSNLVATANVINECIRNGVNRLVFTSSLAVYGHGVDGLFEESQFPSPIDPYGVAKFACEMDIKIAGEQHDLDWCIIRPHNVYGVNQNIWDKYRNVLGIWMYQHINGSPMSIFGDGLQTRAFSYVEDILEPLWNSAIREEASKQIINLGGTKEYSLLEACNTVRDVIGGGDIVHFEERHEVKHSIPQWKKSSDILDYKENVSLKEGLSEMWDWAKKQPNRKRFEWSEYEIDEGIYSYWNIK